MTYQVLARKWRPRSFSEIVGQGHVLKTLINSLDKNRLHHAYLFTGTRGVGKTTIARILAKCLNCENGITSKPCGECGPCREIDEGRFIDLIEVDAASRTKVEDTRELLDNVQYSPSSGRFKVYLIDEVHMLSQHSFNALLKTLEEPPPHVKFLLATTDPQKLPVTVLSRCLQFNLKQISPERLVEHLKYILEQEKISYEEPALWQLGRAAGGSVRDALTLLEQAISFCDGNIRDDEVRSLLGTIDQAIIHKLVDALVAQDAKAVLDVIENTAEFSPDFTAILNELLSYLHKVAIAQVVPEGIDNSQGDKASVLDHAQSMAAENVQLYYQMALNGRDELPLSVDERSGLEMILLRMLAFTPQGVPNSPTVPLGSKAEDSASEPEESRQLKKKSLAKKPDPSPAEAEVQPHADVLKKVEIKSEPQHKEVEDPIPEAPQAVEKSGIRSAIELASLDASCWIPLFHELSLTGITRSITSNCMLQSASEDQIVLMLDESQSSVFNDEHERRIQNALSEYFGKPLKLLIKVGAVNAETPAAYRQRKQQARIQKAIHTFENDDNVKEILQRFSGTIQQDTIEPLTPKPN